MNANKKFFGFWGNGYGKTPKVKKICLTEISEEMGYSKKDVEEINQLEKDQLWVATDNIFVHFIIRIK